MLALKERPPLLWPEYAIVEPVHYSKLIELDKPTYVRGLLSPNHVSKHEIHLLGQTKSKYKTTIKEFKNDTYAYVDALGAKREAVNNYHTPNEFFNWPRTRNLSLLRANWLEIDVNEEIGKFNIRDRVRNLEKQVVNDIFEQLKTNNFPPPTGFVCSGSGGVHFYWIYEPVEARIANVELWRTIAQKLKENIKSNNVWHVDRGATSKIAGNLRTPGSLHQKTGLYARFFNGGVKYIFNELVEEFGLTTDLIRLQNRSAKISFDTKSEQYISSSLHKNSKPYRRYGHSIKEWWLKCVNIIKSHFNQIGYVPEGKRDKTAFILFVAFKHIDKDLAFERLLKVNQDFINLPIEELTRLIQTAKTVNYNYRKETLAEYVESILGYVPDYLQPKESVRLTAGEVKKRQKLSANSTAEKKRQRTNELIISAILELTKRNKVKPTQKQVSEKTGLGISTVKRYWKKNSD
tara:strand:+ start:1160 stop:2545 length:1386 start_codon:yes stop_codon:yes gene_type:complete